MLFRSGRAAIIERQLAVDDVGHEVRLAHGEAAHGIGLEIVLDLEVIVLARIAIGEVERAFEDESRVVIEVHDIGRGGAADQHRRRIRRVDEAMIGVERNGEERTARPFEGLLLRLALAPDFGRAAAFDDIDLLLVEVMLDRKSTRLNSSHIPLSRMPSSA